MNNYRHEKPIIRGYVIPVMTAMSQLCHCFIETAIMMLLSIQEQGIARSLSSGHDE